MTIKGIGTTMFQWDKEFEKRGLDFDENIEQVHKEIKEVGLDGVESRLSLADTDEKALELKKICDNNNLKIASLYGGCKLYDKKVVNDEIENYIKSITSAKKSGCSLITLDMATPEDRKKTDEELRVQVDALNKMGKELEKINMRVGIHNHTPEMENDAREFHYIMENLETDYVGVCLDIAWTVKAGVSPVELIKKYHEKIFDVHVRNIQDKEFTQEITEGSISYPRIIELLEKHDYNGWLVIELAYMEDTDVTRSFKENINRSIWYLKGLTSSFK